MDRHEKIKKDVEEAVRLPLVKPYQAATIEKNKQRILRQKLTYDALTEELAANQYFQTEADIDIQNECSRVLTFNELDSDDLEEDNNLRLVKILVARIESLERSINDITYGKKA